MPSYTVRKAVIPAAGLGTRFLAANRSDRFAGTLAGARIRLRPLAPHGEVAAVPQAPVRADLDEALDVERHLAPEVAFDLEVPVDVLAQPGRRLL